MNNSIQVKGMKMDITITQRIKKQNQIFVLVIGKRNCLELLTIAASAVKFGAGFWTVTGIFLIWWKRREGNGRFGFGICGGRKIFR